MIDKNKNNLCIINPYQMKIKNYYEMKKMDKLIQSHTYMFTTL